MSVLGPGGDTDADMADQRGSSNHRPAALWGAIAGAPRLLGRALIKAYRFTISPLIWSDCRHLPTCSEYSEEAIGRFGLWAGGWMTAARLCRCHPLGTHGLDFVPLKKPARARWYLPWRYGRWRGANVTPPGANGSKSALTR